VLAGPGQKDPRRRGGHVVPRSLVPTGSVGILTRRLSLHESSPDISGESRSVLRFHEQLAMLVTQGSRLGRLAEDLIELALKIANGDEFAEDANAVTLKLETSSRVRSVPRSSGPCAEPEVQMLVSVGRWRDDLDTLESAVNIARVTI